MSPTISSRTLSKDSNTKRATREGVEAGVVVVVEEVVVLEEEVVVEAPVEVEVPLEKAVKRLKSSRGSRTIR